jgi:gas vesicle protein
MEENKGLSYFFLGLGLGVAVGMMFAPQAGADTRGLLRNKAMEGGDYLRKRGEELKENAEDLLQRGKTMVSNQREQLSAAVEAGKQAYRESISQAAESTRTTGSEA